MGQTCTRGGGVADDAKGTSNFGRKGFRKQKKEKNAVQTGSGPTDMTPNETTRIDEPTREKAPPSQEFCVVTKIEALQHTMRPTIPVVGRTELHPEFRQFTPIFTNGYAALSVVSCLNTKLSQQVLMAGEDCTIAQLNYETGHVMRRWVHAHDREINALTRPSATGLFASCGRDCVVKVWNLNRDVPIAVLEGHSLNVTAIDVSEGATSVFSGSKDNTVRMWDIGSGAEVFCADVKQNIVTFVRELPKMNLVAQGSEDLTVRLWDVRAPPTEPAMKLSNTMTEMQYIPLCCDYSPSVDTRLLTGHSGNDKEGSVVQEWDLRASQCVRDYKGHQGNVNCLRMSTSKLFGDTTFFSASADGTMGFWSMESASSKLDVCTLPIDHQFTVPEGSITSCECDNNGDIIVTLRNGSAVVFRPEKQGNTILPAKRFRYIGPMSEAKSLLS